MSEITQSNTLLSLNSASEAVQYQLLDDMSVQLAKVAKTVKKDSDVDKKRSQLGFIIDQSLNSVSNIIYQTANQARAISAKEVVTQLGKSPLKEIDPDLWDEVLTEASRQSRISLESFMNRKSDFDGKTVNQRFKTIKRGTQEVVDNIIRLGIKDGKSTFEIAKDIENYIAKDFRKRWVSPYTILRREKGFPISSPYTNDVPGGSVDYNVLRISRTEVINNYRWAKVDTTKDFDFVIGYTWNLSGSHPSKDICNDWANHDEGLGRGAYRDYREIMKLGHPNCLCFITVKTVFDEDMSPYFDEAYRKFGVPINKYVASQ